MPRARAQTAIELFEPDLLHSDGAELRWSRYAGADFVSYEVHRSTSAGFAPSAETRLVALGDQAATSYRDTTASPSKTFSYKVVANGVASNERTVTLPATGQSRLTLQPGAAAGTSTYVESAPEGGAGCANFGAAPSLGVGSSGASAARGLLRFDLRRVPSDAAISSAELSLHHHAGSASASVAVHALSQSWSEGSGAAACTGDGATWSETRGGVPWSGGPGGAHDATAVATSGEKDRSAAGWDRFDVAALVARWAAADAPVHGVLVRTATEDVTARVVYDSDDAATPAERPSLVVTYADATDAGPPEVEITSPKPGATVQSWGGEIITASAWDESGISAVRFEARQANRAFGGQWSVDYEPPYMSQEMDFGPTGPYVVSAKAFDRDGNTSVAQISVTSAYAPSVTISSPASGATVQGTVPLEATASTTATRVEFLAEDAYGSDGPYVVAADESAPFAAAWDTLQPGNVTPDGAYELTARVYDANGLQRTSTWVTVTVANTVGTRYDAHIATTQVPHTVTPDSTTRVDVTVTNESVTTWPAGETELWYRWRDEAGAVVAQGSLAEVGGGAAIEPGAAVSHAVAVPAPRLPGGVDSAPHDLELDLKDTAGNAFFGARGDPPNENPVVVDHALASALGIERYHHYVPRDAGAGVRQLTNVANGNALLTWTPFTSRGRGLSTVAQLTYNSREVHVGSPVGTNFALSISSLTRFGAPIDVHPNKADELAGNAARYVRLLDADGTPHEFTGHRSGGVVHWDEPDGVHLYLRSYSSTLEGRAEWKWALTRPDGVTFYYDEQGFPRAVEDRNGNVLTFGLEEVAPAEDPGGPRFRVYEVVDSAGTANPAAPNRRYRIGYYSRADTLDPHLLGKVKSVTDHDGSRLDFEYYDDGNLLRIVQRGGPSFDGTVVGDRSIVFTYTTSNLDGPASTDLANPDPATPNQSAQLYSVRDPRGNTTLFAYVTSGQNKGKLAGVTDRAGSTTSFSYDIDNRATTVQDHIGRVTTFRYDTRGRVVGATNAKNETTTLDWWPDNNVKTVTEPSGAATHYEYDDNGFPTKITDQLGRVTTATYEHRPVDANDVAPYWRAGRSTPHLSLLASKTRPRGNEPGAPPGSFTWTFGYDARGNLVQVVDPEQTPTSSTRYEWNDDGTLRASTGPRGGRTEYQAYDDNGLPTRVVDAEGGVTRAAFDADGRIAWLQDANHSHFDQADVEAYRTFFHYDAFHRLTLRSSPKSTRYERGTLLWEGIRYDANDNVVARFEPRFGRHYPGPGAKSTMTYDAMDRMTTTTNADDETSGYEYDAVGRMVEATRPLGMATTGPEGSGFDDDHAVLLDYDALNRVVKRTRKEVNGAGAVVDTLGARNCYADLTGDLVAQVRPKGDSPTFSCANLGRFATRYTYYGDHRVRTITDAEGNDTTYTYDGNGNVATVRVENRDESGALVEDVEKRFYDERDLLVKSVKPLVRGSRSVTTAYVYDAAGNLTRLVSPRAWDSSPDPEPAEESGLKTSFPSFTTDYDYDLLNRTVRIALPRAAGAERSYVHYEYDGIGNRTWTSLPVSVADVASFGPGGTNQASRDDVGTIVGYFDTGWIRTSTTAPNPMVRFDYTPQGWQSRRTPEGEDGQLLTGESVSWRYDRDGTLRERIDRDGQRSKYRYDAHNNLVRAVDASGVDDPDEKPMEILASYDDFDRVTTVKQRKGTTAGAYTHTLFSYDAHGNVTTRVDDAEDGSGTGGRRSLLEYDDTDRLVRQEIHGEDGAKCSDDLLVTNAYKPVGWEDLRVVRRGTGTPASGGCTSWSIKQRTDWEYFATGDLAELDITNANGDTMQSHAIRYVDDGVYVNGHRVEEDFGLSGPSSSAPCRPTASDARPCTATHDYDGRDRLVDSFDGHGGRTKYTFDEPYDGTFGVRPPIVRASNVTTERTYDGATRTTDGALEETKHYTYDANQLQRVAAATTSKYFYDPYGNLDCITTEAGSQAACSPSVDAGAAAALLADYAYDGLDRLKSYRSFQSGAVRDSALYTYDALDRVVEEVTDHAGTADDATMTFEYVGLSAHVATERHATDAAPEGDPARTRVYSYDAYGNRLAMTKQPTAGNPDHFTYAYDPHGSVSLLVGESGNAFASYGYGPYGDEDFELTSPNERLMDSDGALVNHQPTNAYRYTAKRYDTGSNSLDMGARRFDSGTMRFLQQDLFLGGASDLGLSMDPLTQNRYALAGGNPLGFVEWDGHYAVADGGGTASDASGDSPLDGLRDLASRIVDTVKDAISKVSRALGALGGEERDSGGGDDQPWGTYERQDEALELIHREMVNNVNDPVVTTMRAVASCEDELGFFGFLCRPVPHQSTAEHGYLFNKFRQGGDWDHKGELSEKLELERYDDFFFPVRGIEGKEVRYDIWSNIHYGYVLSSTGMSSEEVQMYHQIPIPGVGRSDAGDVATVGIGIELWQEQGFGVEPDDIQAEIVESYDDLVQASIDDPDSPVVIDWRNGW